MNKTLARKVKTPHVLAQPLLAKPALILATLLVLALAPPVTSGEGEVTIQGPLGKGGSVVLDMEFEDGWIDVEVRWTAGPKSAYGSATYDPYDHSDMLFSGMSNHGDESSDVHANVPNVGTFDYRIREFNGTVEWGERHGLQGLVLMAAGDIHQFDIIVHAGTVFGMTIDDDTVIAWEEDFRGDGLDVYADMVFVGYHENQTRTFELPRPFFGEMSYGYGHIEMNGPEGRRVGSQYFTPLDTLGGEHAVTIDGAGLGNLAYWGVAPTFPPQRTM